MNERTPRTIQETSESTRLRSARRWADRALVIGVTVLFLLPFAGVAAISLWFTPGPTGRMVLEPASSAPPSAENDRGTQPYATTFTMTIYSGEQYISLWARDLDTNPFYRQTVEVDGRTVTDQIFRYDRRRLYAARAGTDGDLTWTFYESVQPEDIDLLEVARGPGVWAATYGVGSQELPANGETITVMITSVGEPIPDATFELPAGTTLTPAQ